MTSYRLFPGSSKLALLMQCAFPLITISQVWASKWNERAYFSTRKVKLDHDYLCMAVLVQEIINADYAFVIHTTNPSSGDSSEIYAEVTQYQLAFQAYVIKLLWSISTLILKPRAFIWHFNI